MLKDGYGRVIKYLRLSVTDRCNLRCLYCSPPPPEPDSDRFLPHSEILRYEELERIVGLFAGAGVEKVRLTGGEPLVRRDLVQFAARVARIAGIGTLAVTTNGTLLKQHATELREAGVSRVNISLDTLDREQFRRLSGSDALPDVIEGMEAALDVGFERVKVNAVIFRGFNEDQVVALAGLARERPLGVRFIEYMPMEPRGGAPGGTVASAEILRVLEDNFGELERLGEEGVSTIYRPSGYAGVVGLIAPVTSAFCRRCNRLRLTADGHLKPCLLSNSEFDLKSLVRSGASDEELLREIGRAVAARPEGHRLSSGASAEAGGDISGMRRIGG